VTVFNPEWDFTKWSEYANLRDIQLLYRRAGDSQWHAALDQAFNRVYFAKTVPEVYLLKLFFLVSKPKILGKG
jgi:hypothetical protein